MAEKLSPQNGSHEPATLSDSDIISSTTSTRALRDADLSAVTGGATASGGGFPLGRIYVPTITIKTR
jgi:hypothetical protein